MSDIPDGAGAVVAKMAIAWEMTKKIIGTGRASSDDENKKLWLTIYNEVYEGLRGKTATAGTR